MKLAIAAACFAGAVFLILYIRLTGEIRFLLKQLEELRRGSNMELTTGCRQRTLVRLYSELNGLLAFRDRKRIRYEKAEKLLKQELASLAHDIRTPLTGAAGYVQLARECEAPDRREHYLEAAGKRLTELGDMLEEMFLYTKLAGEEFTLTIQKVQVYLVLSDCLLSLYNRFEEQGSEPEVEFASEGMQVCADEEALRRVFNNLLQNALLHGTGPVRIIQKENRIVFENPVTEEGSLDTERIFDRFYKGDCARRKGSSGLGLFIVKELMERMEGDVRAELAEGRLRIILEFQTPQEKRPVYPR